MKCTDIATFRERAGLATGAQANCDALAVTPKDPKTKALLDIELLEGLPEALPTNRKLSATLVTPPGGMTPPSIPRHCRPFSECGLH